MRVRLRSHTINILRLLSGNRNCNLEYIRNWALGQTELNSLIAKLKDLEASMRAIDSSGEIGSRFSVRLLRNFLAILQLDRKAVHKYHDLCYAYVKT